MGHCTQSDQKRIPSEAQSTVKTRTIALAGNPNSGKTTVFNALTGMNQKVGNYPGVTVEKKVGRMKLPGYSPLEIVDLPGIYSLNPKSLDEQIAFNALTGNVKDLSKPGLVIIVVDSNNLEHHLYLTTQLLDLEIPALLALNMSDVAQSRGIVINKEKLSEILGIPVVSLVASKGEGIPQLVEALKKFLQETESPAPYVRKWRLDPPVEEALGKISGWLKNHGNCEKSARFSEALNVLSNDLALKKWDSIGGSPSLREIVPGLRKDLEGKNIDWETVEVRGRYGWIREICQETTTGLREKAQILSDKIDRVLVHPVVGLLIFMMALIVVFQAIFSFATVPMEMVESLFAWLGATASELLPPGALQGLIVEGIIGGVGNVVIFLPQIILLFFFLSLLEDSGYMPRAALIMDRIMRKFGLPGKSIVPLLSSFACAIPGIMATRTIENPKDRLTTILIAPLMSCSARMPIYILFIGAFIPNTPVFGIFTLSGLTLLCMYLLGIVAAVLVAWVFNKFISKGEVPYLIIELPSYKLPSLKSVFLMIWTQSKEFLLRAGTIIMALTIVLWWVATYPKTTTYSRDFDKQITVLEKKLESGEKGLKKEDLQEKIGTLKREQAAEDLQNSYAGQLGKGIEPALKPLGFDWKLGLGVVMSFAAREVLVSTMGTIYSVSDSGEESEGLRKHLQRDYSPLVAISLMVFFVLACQCISTLALVWRETGTLKWPAFMFAYMTTLAYLASLAVYQGGLLIGFGG